MAKKILEYCKFYYGEQKCPTNVHYDNWFYEKLVSESANNPLFAINSEKEFINRIYDYIAKWNPYECNEIYSKYLEDRQKSI